MERAKTVLLGDDSLGVAACRTPAVGSGDDAACGSGNDGLGRAGAAETLTGSGRGVRPLLQWLAAGTRLDGFCAADRVVGKGAALLYAKLGVKAVWARTMSEAGLATLRAHGIEASCGTLVPVILNRDGTGMCPIERSVADVADDDLDAAETAIRAAVARLMAR